MLHVSRSALIIAAPFLAALLAYVTPAGAGIAVNGVALNGVSMNGITLNGIYLNGLSSNGITFHGSALSDLNGVAVEAVVIPEAAIR